MRWLPLVSILSMLAGHLAVDTPAPPLASRDIGIPAVVYAGSESSSTKKAVPTPLVKGKKYIVDWNAPLVVDGSSFDGGEVEVKQISGPHNYSASIVISMYPADADQVVVVPGEYIYEVTVKTSGTLLLQVFPATGVDKDLKPRPLAKEDIKKRILAVDDGSTPKPPEPDPFDPDTAKLMAAIQNAYNAELDGQAKDQIELLAKVYRVRAPPIVENATTWGGVYKEMVTARQNAIPDNALLKVRRVIEEHLNKRFTRDAATLLDAGGRLVANAEFARIARCLGAVK